MKVLVTHPLQQHSYKLAIAIKEQNCLYKYITCVYQKKYSLTKLMTFFLKGNMKKRSYGRTCNGLKDEEVLLFCEMQGLFRLLCQNIKFLNRYELFVRKHLCDRFAKKVAKYAIKNKVDAVITFDNCSPLLFEILEKKAPNIKRILDVSAANRIYMKKIYDMDLQIAPAFADNLRSECPQIWNHKLYDRNKKEIEKAQFYLSPSVFVDRSLQFSGIENTQIFRASYGIDLSGIQCKEFRKYSEKRPLRFIYVGGVKELKGIYYLLEAFLTYPKEKVCLTVVGDCDLNDEKILEYQRNGINFIGRVLHSDIFKILKQHDVFVFASLGDSFAFSVLEAAACGLPVILTENTGIADQITEGKEGFIIPIQSTSAIQEKIDWFVENPNKISEMGKAARQLSEMMTWNKYNDAIKSCLENIDHTS